MKKWTPAVIMILVILLSACGGSGSGDADTDGVDQATINQGKTVFQANCSACHSATSDATLVGPSMVGLADRAAETVPGLDAYEYIEQSILEPGAYINEGFQDLMPKTYDSTLTDEQLDAVIQYLLTLE